MKDFRLLPKKFLPHLILTLLLVGIIPTLTSAKHIQPQQKKILATYNYINALRKVPGTHPYYGKDFYEHKKNNFKFIQLKTALFKILTAGHLPKENDFDTLLKQCNEDQCYTHQKYSYKATRRFLMGSLHLESQESQDKYSIDGYYCLKKFKEKDFPFNSRIGPGKIPNHTILNTEHAWPQSHFTTRFSKGLQKSDLHHLFPVSASINSTRSNLRFAEVLEVKKHICGETKIGYNTSFTTKKTKNTIYFEPPHVHKGDFARALFYFSTRYKIKIDPAEEANLRKWHLDDPVDYKEILRNERIYNFQQNRNPFIDHPEIVDLIDNF